jgi:hypothetical protein
MPSDDAERADAPDAPDATAREARIAEAVEVMRVALADLTIEEKARGDHKAGGLDRARTTQPRAWAGRTKLIFRYCRYGDLLLALALGWRYAADLGPAHGEWSCLVEWAGEGDPVWLSDRLNPALAT